MKMSCNGCRVLRKGCSENCSLRPCLQWIKSPDSQANATVFLAKFYGRAGLINLINAGPDHLRPDIFKSLLYEACGRIINPVHGSVGLMCSGNWQRCLEAVEAVLKGTNIMQFPINNEEDSTSHEVPHQIIPFKGCDIRHLSKNSSEGPVHHVKIRNRFKRRATKADTMISVPVEQEYVTNEPSKFSITGWDFDQLEEELKRAPSHDSFSVETVEPSLVNQAGPVLPMKLEEVGEVGLELTLGLMT